MRKFAAILVVYLASTLAVAADQLTFQFKNPSFNGNGWSSMALTIQQQEFSREQQIKADKKAAADAIEAAKTNTNLQKFLNNLESRIYAQISQNVATAMFANNSCTVTTSSTCTGSINFQGSTIAWSRVSDAINCTGSANGTCILLTVTDTAGTTTSIYVPLESFNMPGN
jgi:hypothetical protein